MPVSWKASVSSGSSCSRRPSKTAAARFACCGSEIMGEDLLAAEPQRFQEPPGAAGETRRQHGNRFRIIHPQVAGDAVAAIEVRAIDLAGVQGMFGRQEMGKGLEAIARGQVGNQALDDHGRAAGSGPPTGRRREWPAVPPRNGSRRPIAATAGD